MRTKHCTCLYNKHTRLIIDTKEHEYTRDTHLESVIHVAELTWRSASDPSTITLNAYNPKIHEPETTYEAKAFSERMTEVWCVYVMTQPADQEQLMTLLLTYYVHVPHIRHPCGTPVMKAVMDLTIRVSHWRYNRRGPWFIMIRNSNDWSRKYI